ncbi:MAG: TRAP transporter small permease subunit [Pseudomonadota bacterium]
MGFLLRSRLLLDTVTRAVAIIGFTGLVVIGLLTMYDGLARYTGLTRIPGFNDFGEVIFAVIIASCFPAGLLKNQNITITILGKLTGRWGHAILNLFGALATLVVFVLVAWALGRRADGLAGRVTQTGYMDVAPWWWITFAIILAATLVQVWVVLARIAELATGEPLVDDRGGATEHGLEEGLIDEAAEQHPESSGGRFR